MSREKHSRAELAVNSGSQRFAVREKELPTIADVSGRFENPALDALMRKSAIPLVGHQARELPHTAELRTPFCNPAIQDSRMTLALFVETKFIPEHVQYKASAGQTHYQAILKHLITPETVGRIFNHGKIANTRLKAVPEWPYLDAIRLCDLRPEHVRCVVSAAVNAGYSAQTVKHIKNVCFAIIAHAQREGCFSGSNPASLVKLPRIMRSSSPGLTIEQTRAILNSLRYPHRDIVLFALTTGMTLPEICDLRWKDVNLDDSERLDDGQPIPARTVIVKTKWNHGGLGDSRACSKSKHIEIREPLLSTLRELRKKRSGRNAEDLVLVSDTGDQIMPASVRIGEVKRVGKSLGIPSLRWQDLRRTHQVLPGGALCQLFSSMPLYPETVGARSPRHQVEFSANAVFKSGISNSSSSRRSFCFGERLRICSNLDHSSDEQGWFYNENRCL